MDYGSVPTSRGIVRFASFGDFDVDQASGEHSREVEGPLQLRRSGCRTGRPTVLSVIKAYREAGLSH